MTTHTWESRRETLRMVAAAGMEVCSGGILGMGESLEQRAEFASDLAELNPTEVPMNFLDPRPGTPFADKRSWPPPMHCGQSARFGWRCPRRSCGLPAAGSSPWRPGYGAGPARRHQRNDCGQLLDYVGSPDGNDLDMLDKLRIPLKVLTTSV